MQHTTMHTTAVPLANSLPFILNAHGKTKCSETEKKLCTHKLHAYQ